MLTGTGASSAILTTTSLLTSQVSGTTSVRGYIVLTTTGQILAEITFTSVSQGLAPRDIDIELIAVRLREIGIDVQASEIAVRTSIAETRVGVRF